MINRWIFIGSISGLIGVAMGAFGAHALAARLSEKAMSIYHTAAQYQIYHALALIGLGAWVASMPTTTAQIPGWAFTIGTVLFSGSLYALALTDIKAFGAITPFGGLAFMLGWATFAYSAVK